MKRKIWQNIAIGIIIFILGGVLMPNHKAKSSSATAVPVEATTGEASAAAVPVEATTGEASATPETPDEATAAEASATPETPDEATAAEASATPAETPDEATAAEASATSAAEPEPDDTLPIRELTQAYYDNEVAAKRKYQGKTFKFKGRVTDIGDVLGEAYVHLDHNIGVHFYFRNSDVVANLKKGDKIKLEGRIDSNFSSIISVKNCRLVE